jgi:predicted GNAT family acetyltransferase
MSETVTYNTDTQRYELVQDGHVVYANTRSEDGVLYIDYVYAPTELRGTGAAGRFMQGLMDLVRGEGAGGLKVVPVCGYAAAWLRKNEATYGDLLA